MAPCLPLLLATTSVLVLSSGCVKDKSKKAPADEIKAIDASPLPPQAPGVPPLEVRVDFTVNGMTLHLAKVPEGATIECRLDTEPLTPCHDGAVYARPADGEHRIFVAAFKDKKQITTGQSEPIQVKGTTASVAEANTSGLRLVFEADTIKDDAPVPMDQDLLLRFKFETPPACDAKVQCQFGTQGTPFWTDCAADGKSYLVRKGTGMSLGKQYFAVRAKCTEQLGPALRLQWYGVPAGYQPLQVQATKDPSKGRYLVDLVRPVDCPATDASHYECAEKPDSAFTRCPDGNTVTTTTKGFRVRFVCGEKTGPEFILVP